MIDQEIAAGRELDVEVCQKVFDRYVDLDASTVPGHQLLPGQTFPAYRDGSFLLTVPRYSILIDAVWEIVQKMVDVRGYGFHLDRVGQKWEATFTKDGDRQYGESWKCQSSTAPLAICRAALAAVVG